MGNKGFVIGLAIGWYVLSAAGVAKVPNRCNEPIGFLAAILAPVMFLAGGPIAATIPGDLPLKPCPGLQP